MRSYSVADDDVQPLVLVCPGESAGLGCPGLVRMYCRFVVVSLDIRFRQERGIVFGLDAGSLKLEFDRG